jgi:hypothetical protein
MHEAAPVRGVEGVRDLREDRQRSLRSELAFAREEGLQVLPLDEAHRQLELLVVLARLVDGDQDHVGVVERGAKRVSRRKRARKRSFSASSGAISLSATGRSSDRERRSARARCLPATWWTRCRSWRHGGGLPRH